MPAWPASVSHTLAASRRSDRRDFGTRRGDASPRFAICASQVGCDGYSFAGSRGASSPLLDQDLTTLRDCLTRERAIARGTSAVPGTDGADRGWLNDRGVFDCM